MLEEALVVLLYISLIVFVIALTVLCIKLIGTLGRADKLIENITRKAETLDGVFNILDYTTSKFSMLGEAISGYVMGFVKKLTKRKNKNESEEEDYE